MKFTRQRTNQSKDLLVDISDFSGGSNNLIDQSKMPPKFAVQANNMMQVQNGLWKTRWGTQYYGSALPANPDGVQEYVKSDGTTELIAISNGSAYKSTDGGTWTSISGASFTAGTQCYFMQLGGYDSTNTFKNYLYIANGTDVLARYNGSTLETYTSLAAPSSLTASLVASGLTSGTHVYYAQVTALNTVGESVGSTEASITTNKIRTNWVAGTDKVTWSWGTVSGATRYQLYISDVAGYESLLTSTDVTNYTDDGTLDINPYVQVPYDNTTTAPKFKSMCTSNNRIFATNNDSDRYKVYFSGTGRNIGAFSDFFGGGWINLERGGRETPVAVKHYQSGSGEGRATVLCNTPDGSGAVWQIQISSASVGDSTFSIPSAAKVVGSFGTESILGVVATDNNIEFPNRKGWFTLGPEKQYFGILRTAEQSSSIRPYWRSLVGSKISGICSYYYDAKIFISVPTGTSGNDRIIVRDTERGNWAVDWSIGAKQFLEYTDTSKNSHLLYVPTSGTKLIELSENYLNDLGTAFYQSYVSPLLPVSKDKTDVMSLKEAIVELGQPQGAVNFQILGIGKGDSFATLATKTITDFGSNTGVGSDLAGDFFATSTNDNSLDGQGRIITSGFEGNSLTEGFSVYEGSPTISSSIKLNGSYSLKCDPLQSIRYTLHPTGKTAIYTRTNLYISSMPTDNAFAHTTYGSIVSIESKDGDSILGLQINDQGKINGFTDGAAATFSNLTTLSTATWYRIETFTDLTTPASGTIQVYVNGVSILSTTTDFTGLTTKSAKYLIIGNDILGGDIDTGTIYFDDIAANLNDWAGDDEGATVYFTDTPSTFTQSTVKKAIKKRAKIYFIQYKVYSSTADTRFTINSLQAKGRLIASRIPSAWAN